MNLARPQLGLPVNFTRPELSPCLARLPDKSDPRLQGGPGDPPRRPRTMLRKQPGADLPGFRLCTPAEFGRRRSTRPCAGRRRRLVGRSWEAGKRYGRDESAPTGSARKTPLRTTPVTLRSGASHLTAGAWAGEQPVAHGMGRKSGWPRYFRFRRPE